MWWKRVSRRPVGSVQISEDGRAPVRTRDLQHVACSEEGPVDGTPVRLLILVKEPWPAFLEQREVTLAERPTLGDMRKVGASLEERRDKGGSVARGHELVETHKHAQAPGTVTPRRPPTRARAE